VKGDNVLVRADGRAFLTDFGAGHYRGAATLTGKVLPPGTPAYRSPEAWEYLHLFARHPTAHYAASACDDLFALGVMAHRLVTDEYPPPTQPGARGSEVWREGGPGPRSPRELNPRVSPALEAIILRLLSRAPVERFQGRAQEAVEALERAAEEPGPEGEALLFSWGHEHYPRVRSPGGVRLAEEQDAAARQEQAQREEQERARAQAGREQAAPQAFASVRSAAVAVAFLVLWLVGLTVAVLRQGHKVARSASDRAAYEGESVAMGDSASTTPAGTSAARLTEDTKRGVRLPLPEQPLPGQNRPPCKRLGEVEIRGGCWHRVAEAKPPCKEEGKEDAYVWKGACYLPSSPVGREPTSSPP
jgi:hypothetical protein